MHPKILNGKIYSKDEMNSAEYLRPSDHKKTDSASVCFHNGWTSFLKMHSRHIYLVSLCLFGALLSATPNFDYLKGYCEDKITVTP